MEIVALIIQSLAALLGYLTALPSILFFMQLHWPDPALWFLKIYSSALSTLFILIGVVSTIVGLATYWIDRKFWGQGFAIAALKDFLKIEQIRPFYGRVAIDNYSSQKVLEKSGFIKIGKERGFANARQTEIEEYIYKLSG